MNVRYFVGLGALGTSIALTVLPNTSYLNTYRKLKAKYRLDQTEEPVKEKYQKRFENVMDDLKLSDEYRKRLQLFCVYGHDVFTAGSLKKTTGGIIGIPKCYEYENVNEVDKSQIIIHNQVLDYTKKTPNDLIEAMVLSENAQKYAIARAILRLESRNLKTEVLTLIIHTFFTILVYDMFAFMVPLFQKKLHRFLLGVFVYSSSFFLWMGMKISCNCDRDVKINDKLFSLGPEYIEGAIEFYSKLYHRNSALKILLEIPDNNFKTHLYENYFPWHKGLSIIEHYTYMNEKLQKVEQMQ